MGRRVCGCRVIDAAIKRRLVWPTLTAAVMLGLTLSLGIWQLDRLSWKTALLASIERGEAMPAIALPRDPEAYRRYRVSGRFGPEQARYGAEVRQGVGGPVFGEHVMAVLLRPGELPLVVDRGWAPDGVVEVPSGSVLTEGYIRPPEHTPWMGARDDPANRSFYALDPAAIGASLGYPSVAPFTLVAIGPRGTIPDPVQALPRPPNDHLSYAVTWFSLSAALVVVFVVYVRQAGG